MEKLRPESIGVKSYIESVWVYPAAYRTPGDGSVQPILCLTRRLEFFMVTIKADPGQT